MLALMVDWAHCATYWSTRELLSLQSVKRETSGCPNLRGSVKQLQNDLTRHGEAATCEDMSYNAPLHISQ